MGQRVFVTGAAGFVGAAVVEELVKRGFCVDALVNRRGLQSTEGDIRPVRADLFDSEALAREMEDAAAVIHLVGIIMEKPNAGLTFARMHVEATRSVVGAAERAGVSRYIHMSALGTRPAAISNYHQSKFLGEEIVRSSNLKWTIFRPSMIHGARGEFMKMEAKWARKQSPPFLFMPYFGSGIAGFGAKKLVQPVFVGDVARAFVDALGNEKSIGRIYPLAGAETLTWPQMHKTVARAITGKSRWAGAIPAWYAKVLARVVPGSLLPFNRDQVLMSQEDNTADIGEFERDFGWKPAGFGESLGGYAGLI
jgi:NADH dehydrogenase